MLQILYNFEGFLAYKIDIKRPSEGTFSQIEGKIVIIFGYDGHFQHRFLHYFIKIKKNTFWYIRASIQDEESTFSISPVPLER